MKSIKLYLVATFSIIALSCSSDNEIEENSVNSTIKGNGNYTVNSNTTSTNYAYWYNFSDGATFSLKNLPLSNQSQVYNDTSDTVWFDLRPNHNGSITEGNYTFSKTGNGLTLFIQDGGHNIDEFQSGDITITKNGNIFSVNYDMNLQSGKRITGTYSGPITIVF